MSPQNTVSSDVRVRILVHQISAGIVEDPKLLIDDPHLHKEMVKQRIRDGVRPVFIVVRPKENPQYITTLADAVAVS